MIRVLATDLDGTLIPLPTEPAHPHDLRTLEATLQQHDVTLLFATGRHPASMQEAIQEFSLPLPKYAICDVGTTILKHDGDGQFSAVVAYQEHLAEVCQSCPAEKVREFCNDVEGARLQEDAKQGAFKISFYTDENELKRVRQRFDELLQQHSADWNVIASVDPFTRDGLIDVLPKGVSKSHAIDWWSRHYNIPATSIAYSGDSSNDLAALTAGYHGIVVANAADDLLEHLQANNDQHSLFYATKTATSGVLEGIRSFLEASK